MAWSGNYWPLFISYLHNLPFLWVSLSKCIFLIPHDLNLRNCLKGLFFLLSVRGKRGFLLHGRLHIFWNYFTHLGLGNRHLIGLFFLLHHHCVFLVFSHIVLHRHLADCRAIANNNILRVFFDFHFWVELIILSDCWCGANKVNFLRRQALKFVFEKYHSMVLFYFTKNSQSNIPNLRCAIIGKWN